MFFHDVVATKMQKATLQIRAVQLVGHQMVLWPMRVSFHSPKYRVFKKELYNFERVHKFIQRTYTMF
jgi:hypothetical protein